MWPWFSKHVLYRPLQVLRREPVMRHIRDLERSQWSSPEELRARQSARLRDLVAHAARTIPHYREAFGRAGVRAADVERVEDLARLPVLEKAEARAAGRRLVSEACTARLDSRKTSGSTGVPMPILKARDTVGRIRAIWYRYLRWYDIDIGSRQARFLGHPVSLKGRLREDVQDFILNKDRLDPVYLTPENLSAFRRRTERRPPDHFYGYPSAMAAFTRFLTAEGVENPPARLRALVCTGETLYPFQRELLESFWRAPVVNEYGCTESGILAFPCPEEGRLHVSADNLILEVAVGHRPAEPGERGEVLVTELYSRDVPLIRYRLGDMVVPSGADRCPCGRGLPTIESVEGRTSELIRLPNGREVHSEVFSYVSDCFAEVDASIEGFRVRLAADGRFTLQLLSPERLAGDVHERLAALVRRVLGEDIPLAVEQVDRLPRDPSGKLRYFVRDEPEKNGGDA